MTPQELTFTETPFNLNVTFAAGETSKRIAVLTEDDYRVEDDGTVTLSVPAKPDQYKYIPGPAPPRPPTCAITTCLQRFPCTGFDPSTLTTLPDWTRSWRAAVYPDGVRASPGANRCW